MLDIQVGPWPQLGLSAREVREEVFVREQGIPKDLELDEADQTAVHALVINHLGPADEGRLVYFMSIDKARFRKPVLPGHTVHFPVKLIQKRAPVWRFEAEARVDGQLMAQAEISAMLMGKPKG